MPMSAVQTYYRRQAFLYDATRWSFLLGRRNAVRHLMLRPDSHVLEIGSGTGLNFALLVRGLSATRGSVTGLDFSTHMLDRARRRIDRARWTNVSLIEADATAFDLGKSFDAVFICYALSMISGWRETIRLAHDHLRSGGRLVIHDFDRFERWGPIGPAMRWFQRRNHVDTSRPVAEVVNDVFGNATRSLRLGGYHCTIAATRA